MGKELAVVIPRIAGNKMVDVKATVKDEQFQCSDSELLAVLRCFRLDSGHHADRDLELAQMAVRGLGGKVVDNRLPNNAKHGIPR